MKEVYDNLFVGSDIDFQSLPNIPDWFVIHACKEPYHRQALGYSGRAAPNNHPEYLIARREGRLMLNLIDVDNYKYIPNEIIDVAVQAIHENIFQKNVLVHCNQGFSRSPSIAFLYLAKHTNVFQNQNLEQALKTFVQLYPAYSPAMGIREFIRLNWGEYNSE